MIAIGSDHGGFALKQAVIEYLDSKKISYHDIGCHSTDSCDYAYSAKAACELVVNGECD